MQRWPPCGNGRTGNACPARSAPTASPTVRCTSSWARAGQYVEIWRDIDGVWEMVLDVFEKASAEHGITVRFMAAVDRVMDGPHAAMVIAELAVRMRDRGIVSFGLHNDEVGHPPQDFIECFEVAKASGLLIIPPAGELESGQFVKDSVDLLGVDRIQHGVRSFEVPGSARRPALPRSLEKFAEHPAEFDRDTIGLGVHFHRQVEW